MCYLCNLRSSILLLHIVIKLLVLKYSPKNEALNEQKIRLNKLRIKIKTVSS